MSPSDPDEDVTSAPTAVTGVSSLVASLQRAPARIGRGWRSSIQVRTVTATMLLGTLVVLMLGGYLYTAIARGLEDDRVERAKAEAAQLTTRAQEDFDSAEQSTPDALRERSQQIVQVLGPPGDDETRFVVLSRSRGNLSTLILETVTSGRIGPTAISDEMREAVAANPGRQQVQLIRYDDPALGRSVPGVVVGAQVGVPIAGLYDLYVIYPMQLEEATLALMLRSFALAGVVLVLLVGAIAWLLTRQVVAPVRRTAQAAQRLEQGQLGERVTARGEDDIAKLASAFNSMADALQSQIRQLEGLSRVQQRFVSDVSHELRTPLTTVRMAADLIHDARSAFSPTVSRSAELLFTELNRFEELLSDLLEISRFDAGAADTDTEPTDVASLVEQVVRSVAALAQRRGSEVVIDRPAQPCTADVDPRRVDRILRNLVVNAIEHGEGRDVEVGIACNDSAVSVLVADHGVGLRPGEAALVFNRFWRADPARARHTGGTGLGLAIALEDARLHHGWLQAWGEPGVGSRFRLTLPRQLDAPIEAAPLPLAPTDRVRGR